MGAECLNLRNSFITISSLRIPDFLFHFFWPFCHNGVKIILRFQCYFYARYLWKFFLIHIKIVWTNGYKYKKMILKMIPTHCALHCIFCFYSVSFFDRKIHTIDMLLLLEPPKLKVAKIEGCQNWNCQNWKLLGC